MTREIIREIIENFKQQKQCYSRMSDLASEQLAILEKSQGQVYASEIDGLLRQRKEILDEINENNRKNKNLQQKIVKELGIEEFVLGQLEGSLESDHYQALKEQISNLSQLLEMISEKDQQSQELMQQAIKSKRQKKPRGSSQQASQAYKQSKLTRE
ncbi:hypothetical protein [Syntrophomonas wolfei]|uniref:Flagellar protein FlgN n=1 Tax=Syntrophomonas wolfei subsp. wolfei (strain DSM 2245B / Goettingen) TaxID=335541 RepID=Q0B0B7_SYNWW|nr:hypothetical protein [Syntrophomonas wolfei]ABI67587.1 hypothetical protein Swol_0235 [Syntrophomonas wolfei subsp. wolfei str. Goettingen G311]